MHQSRLAGFIIDCNVPDLAAAAAFWGAALRMDIRALPAEEGSKYMRLVDPEGRLHIEVQTVTHPSRVHLDIESTDVEAEVAAARRAGGQARGAGAHVVGHGSAHWPAFLRGAEEFGAHCARALAPHRRNARHRPVSTTCWPTTPSSNPRPCTRRSRARQSRTSTWPQQASS